MLNGIKQIEFKHAIFERVYSLYCKAVEQSLYWTRSDKTNLIKLSQELKADLTSKKDAIISQVEILGPEKNPVKDLKIAIQKTDLKNLFQKLKTALTSKKDTLVSQAEIEVVLEEYKGLFAKAMDFMFDVLNKDPSLKNHFEENRIQKLDKMCREALMNGRRDDACHEEIISRFDKQLMPISASMIPITELLDPATPQGEIILNKVLANPKDLFNLAEAMPNPDTRKRIRESIYWGYLQPSFWHQMQVDQIAICDQVRKMCEEKQYYCRNPDSIVAFIAKVASLYQLDISEKTMNAMNELKEKPASCFTMIDALDGYINLLSYYKVLNKPRMQLILNLLITAESEFLLNTIDNFLCTPKRGKMDPNPQDTKHHLIDQMASFEKRYQDAIATTVEMEKTSQRP